MDASLLARAWAKPLTRMLLLSISLHLAFIMIVRPRPFPARDETVVISARLTREAASLDVPERVDEPVLETPPADPPEPMPPPPEAVSPPSPPITVAKAESTQTQPQTQPPTPAVETPPTQPAVTKAKPPDTPRGAEPPPSGLPSVPVMIDTTWYETRQLDVSPRASRPVKPAYPEDAIRQGIEGSVKLMLRVDEFGVVREVEVVEGDPPGVFDQSALEAFRTARFEAGRKDRRPVRSLIYIRVHYELDD